MVTLIVGESPCRIPQILDIMRNSANFSLFHSIWQEFAKRLEVTEKSVLQLKNDLKWEVINLEGLLTELLYSWTRKYGDDAKLSVLCKALRDCNAKDFADKLEAEFTEILKAQFLATAEIRVQGQLIKMSDIFNTAEFSPRIAKRLRKTLDPIQILNRLVIPDPYVSTVPFGEFVQLLVDQLDEQELKVLERCSFKWLFPPKLAEILIAECNNDEDEARQLVQLEKNRVLWFIAARGILNAKLNEQQRQQILAHIFECEEDKEEKKREGVEADVTVLSRKKKCYKFKHELLVEFMDWLMGNGYELSLNFQLNWLDQYLDVCFSYKNLTKHLFNMPSSRVYSLPGLLHRLVEDTVSLQASELDERVNLFLNIIRENPGLVNSFNQYGKPPIHMEAIHVELIDLLIYAGASVNKADYCGRNFVHVSAKYLPSDQFQLLVRYLEDHRLTHLLNSRDFEQWPPLFYLIRYNAKSDPSALQVAAAAGTDFNATDKYGETVLFLAVECNRSVEILQALVGCGADWKCKDPLTKLNLLHVAAYRGNLETVKYLVGLGIDVNSPDCGLLTPLMKAVRNAKKGCNVEVVKFLLENNADVNAADKIGNTALHYAQKLEQKEAFELLISKGATLLSKGKKIKIMGANPVRLRF